MGWKLLAVNIHVKFNFKFCDGTEYLSSDILIMKEQQNSVQL